MRQITDSVSRVRTIADGCGHYDQVVTGRGRTPSDVLAALHGAALARAAETVARFPSALPDPDACWHAGSRDDDWEPGWLAFGTLASQYASPEDPGWREMRPLPSFRDRATRRLGR